MHYVMSDIHGCYTAYRKALELIGFSQNDILYVVGDIVDRGEEPVKVLQDMMYRDNVIPILGNHEFMMMRVLPVFSREITEESIAQLTEEDLMAWTAWTMDGGDVTARQWAALSVSEREDLLDYVSDFLLYAEVQVCGRQYLLVHAGPEPYIPGKSMEEYDLGDLLFCSLDPDRVYDPDRYIVNGHTPTLMFEDERSGRIVEQNNQIRIDCGCVFGGTLGVYRLEDGRKYYVNRKGEIT